MAEAAILFFLQKMVVLATIYILGCSFSSTYQFDENPSIRVVVMHFDEIQDGGRHGNFLVT